MRVAWRLYLYILRINKEAHLNNLLAMTFVAALLMPLAVPAAEPNEKTVFVTNESFKGKNLGGLTGADDKCRTEADDPASIVPSGNYLAWLSDGTDSPDTRFTKSSHPYILPDGSKIAEDYSDLTDGSILHPLDMEATGNRINGADKFWTGTFADGKSASHSVTCTGWKADPLTYHKGMHGQTDLTTSSWSTLHANDSCTTSYSRLLCFQQ